MTDLPTFTLITEIEAGRAVTVILPAEDDETGGISPQDGHARAAAALSLYRRMGYSDDAALDAMLIDLMHWSRLEGRDFKAVRKSARKSFESETADHPAQAA